MRFVIIFLITVWTLPAGAGTVECDRLLAENRATVDHRDALDAQYFRIDDHPELRVNRFLASFRQDTLDPAAKREWLSRLHALAMDSLSIEAHNAGLSAARTEAAKQCLEARFDRLLADPDGFEHVASAIDVPDGYRTWQRFLGLYWITRLMTLAGVKRWHNEARTSFGHHQQDERPYRPAATRPGQVDTGDLLSRAAARSHLNIPRFRAGEQNRLLRQFAPHLAIAGDEAFDRPGSPGFAGDRIVVDTGAPVAYTWISFSRFETGIVTQLNYLFWFPKRPKRLPLDPYGGKLDGIIWRVNLDVNGNILLYDSVHACGCYHKFYPVDDRLTPATLPHLTEQPLILPGDYPAGPVTVHLESGTHYVVDVTPLGAHNTTVEDSAHNSYRFARFRRLRSLDAADGRRSLFPPSGIIRASRRLERWFMWPMGVPSAGAMRQRGHHATAFVGKRQFDAPWLFKRVFDLPPGQSTADLN